MCILVCDCVRVRKRGGVKSTVRRYYTNLTPAEALMRLDTYVKARNTAKPRTPLSLKVVEVTTLPQNIAWVIPTRGELRVARGRGLDIYDRFMFVEYLKQSAEEFS